MIPDFQDTKPHYFTDESFCQSRISSLQFKDPLDLDNDMSLENEGSPTAFETNRVKRQAASSAYEDEDWVDPAQAAIVNNPLMMEQMRSYLESKISGEMGGATSYSANTRGIPSLVLLEQSLGIMKVLSN